MKKQFTLGLTVFALMFGFISCTDEGEGDLTGEQAKEAIIGKWVVITFIDIDDGRNYDYEHECSTKKDYIEFKKNNIVQSIYYDNDCSEEEKEIENATYQIIGNQLIVSGEETDTHTYTFKISKNELTLTDDEGDTRLKRY